MGQRKDIKIGGLKIQVLILSWPLVGNFFSPFWISLSSMSRGGWQTQGFKDTVITNTSTTLALAGHSAELFTWFNSPHNHMKKDYYGSYFQKRKLGHRKVK